MIRATMEGPARFTEIRGSVDGLSARLLSERLRELEAAGLMERRELRGGAVEYRLTPKGEALSRVVSEIEAWVESWDPPSASRPEPAFHRGRLRRSWSRSRSSPSTRSR